MLSRVSFKASINTYWVTSRESPDALWVAELSSNEPEVEKFTARSNDGCPEQSFFTFADTFEDFLCKWDSKVHRLTALPVRYPCVTCALPVRYPCGVILSHVV